ncbi:MAG: hypothetical protein A3D56_02640 [Candidatus Taylorbacteria bacterium RIFCSPHIGHO2_02_FULL_45_35]|uniref:Uncharacterized protein n=1 Tax=Candidatus Taylorbacteria bacterium RIFCSPHIGHO2_02_FULL_45_35 TaxID=1802311 RepID=A0A1G2MS38_9BACT|nr:MAG: hypothetical protein A3D56_02640 [Candidatus Taylorbacteria bacterium RIFCSPHIGHO2_02_FULL_45_35]OHA32591.1 MAG: hypothetical protein A3A22_01950 [Candidatus Taylorbacteria bacterium RIFCSPLOWO2_01_FULL_45_34b]
MGNSGCGEESSNKQKPRPHNEGAQIRKEIPMGDLIRTPLSELNATIELFDRYGVTAEHLAHLRKKPPEYQTLVARVLKFDPFMSRVVSLGQFLIDGGFSEGDLEYVSQNQSVLGKLLELVRGAIDCDTPVFIPDGWEVLPEAEQLPNRVKGKFAWNPKEVTLHLANGQKNGKWIEGNKLRKELVKQPVYTAHLLDYLLVTENQHLIPEEWKGKWIFFWGTIYRGRYGNLYVRCLYWCGGRWFWSYYWLDDVWFGAYPAAVRASA